MAKRRGSDGKRKQRGNGSGRRKAFDHCEDFSEALQVVFETSGSERREAVERMGMIAAVEPVLATFMCRLMYCSPVFVQDPLAAVGWAIRGMEGGDPDAAPWLAFFLIRDDDLDPCGSLIDAAPSAFYAREGWYAADPGILVHPAFRVLMTVTDTGGDGLSSSGGCKGPDGGFDGAVFSIGPEGGGSDRIVLLHRPTRLSIAWTADGASEDLVETDAPVSRDEIIRTLLDCIASVAYIMCRKRPDHEDVPARLQFWNGHPDAVIRKEDDIRRALELPSNDSNGEMPFGRVSQFSLSVRHDGAVEQMSVYDRGEHGLRIYGPLGRCDAPRGPDTERLMYAACLTPMGSLRDYGPVRRDGLQWSLEVENGLRAQAWSGTVVPRFLGTILDAMGRVPSGESGMEGVLARFSVFPRLDLHPHAIGSQRAEMVSVMSSATGREIAEGGCVFEWQEVSIDSDGCSMDFRLRNGRSETYLSEDIAMDAGAMRAVFRIFEGISEPSSDPACPWRITVCFDDGGTAVLSGRRAVGLLERMRDAVSPYLAELPDRILADLEAEGVPRSALEGREIVVFDGIDRIYPDYYGLDGGLRTGRNDNTFESPHGCMESGFTESEHIIIDGGRRLFGVLYTPDGMEGRMPAVVLSHGFGDVFTYGDRLARRLASHGYLVYSFDYRGGASVNGSDGSFLDMSVLTEAEDLDIVLDDVLSIPEVDGDRAYLVGESQGGYVAAYVAARRPGDVRAMALYYPGFNISPMMADLVARGVPDTFEMLGKTVGRRYAEDAASVDIYGVIGGYKGPVLIMHGDRDEKVPIDWSRRALPLYADVRFELFEGQGHKFLGDDGIRAEEMVLGFLDGNGGRDRDGIREGRLRGIRDPRHPSRSGRRRPASRRDSLPWLRRDLQGQSRLRRGVRIPWIHGLLHRLPRGVSVELQRRGHARYERPDGGG